MQNEVYRFGEAELSNVDTRREKHFSILVVLLPWLE